jgi:hypothetical protein
LTAASGADNVRRGNHDGTTSIPMFSHSAKRSFRSRLACLIWVACLVVLARRALPAEQPPKTDASPPASESLSALAQRIVIDSLPKQFEDQRDWGQTKKIVNGLHLKEEGDRLTIEKHTKEVKDGIWKQYRIEVVDPEHQLQIRIANFRQIDPEHSAFQIMLSAKLHGEGRWEQWKDGIKLLNANADADCRIEARLDCEMAVDWKPSEVLGQLSIEPKVTAARLELVDFDLKKVSKIEGRAAHELGERLQNTLAKKLHAEEPKLVEKLNKAIQKRQDRLRFSPDDVVANGLSKLESLFDADEKQK